MHGLALAFAFLAAAAPHRTKVAVLDLSTSQADHAFADKLTPVVVAEFAQHPELQVVSTREIAAALGLERQKQLLGCNEDHCLAEIGGALGVDYLVNGTLSRIGTRFRLDLRLVRASNASIVGSAGDFVTANEDALADATVRLSDKLAQQLLASKPSNASAAAAGGLAQSASTSPEAPSHTGAYVAWGAAGALLVGAVAMTLVTRSTFDDVSAHGDVNGNADSLSWKGPVADALWAGALAAGGVGTYLYLSAAPSSGGGAGVAVGGSF